MQTTNGAQPRPGTIHRPTRASLPPVQGCAPAPVPNTPVVFVADVFGASGLTHREDFTRMTPAGQHVAQIKRTTATKGS